jgi:hypothetical protein
MLGVTYKTAWSGDEVRPFHGIDDADRAIRVLRGAKGKRLTHQQTNDKRGAKTSL